jgi:hypothetical protein
MTQQRVTVFDTISKTDADYFMQHAAEFKTYNLQVDLNSIGRDVDAAMQIGRIIRRNEGAISVAKNAKCYSSCALIYIVGVRTIT